MSTGTLHFVEVAVAALAGPASAMAGSTGTGRVAAGDDRGEVGLWDASGERLVACRVGGAVQDLDVAPDGRRLGVRSANGELTIIDVATRDAFTAPCPAHGLVRLDPTGEGWICVDAANGRVETFNARGRSIGVYAVPSSLVGCVVNPRDGGLLVATPRGVVARFTPWGAQVWAVDLAQQTGALAVDRRGTLLVAVGYGRGADGIHPEDGSSHGAFDVSRSVEAAAAAKKHVLLGTGDARLILVDRSANALAETRLPAKPRAVCLRDDARHAAALLDDGTVRLFHLSDVESDEPRRATIVGGAPEGRFPPREAFRRRLTTANATGRRPIVAVSTDGARIAVADDANRALLLSRDGAVLQEARHDGRVMALQFVGDAALLVSTREARAVSVEATRLVKAFTLHLWRAAIAADGRSFATIDELGVLRLHDAATGRDRFTRELGSTDVPRTLFAAAGRVAWRRPSGGSAVTDGDEVHQLTEGDADRAPRLVAASDDGAFLASATLDAYAWDGVLVWSRPLPGPVAGAAVAPDGSIVVIAGTEALRFGRDGSPLARFAAPLGRLGPVCPDEQGEPVVSFVDGRRVVVVDARGRPQWHSTLREEVEAAATSREGRSFAAATAEGVLLLETVPPPAAPHMAASPRA